MPKERKFYLDEANTEEISISWSGIWKDVTVKHNGEFVGSFPNMSALKQGNTFTLIDGSSLAVYLSTERDSAGLNIEHNGRPVKGTVATPQQQLAAIFGIACFIGGLNFIVGALGQFEISEMLVEMGANWILMLIGAAIIGLGYVVWKKASAAALGGIIGILVVDILSTFYFASEAGGNVPFGGVALKVLFIIQFARGFKHIAAYRNQEDNDRNVMNQQPLQ